MMSETLRKIGSKLGAQVSYPATLGHPNINYLIADSVTIPDENLRYFTESI